MKCWRNVGDGSANGTDIAKFWPRKRPPLVNQVGKYYFLSTILPECTLFFWETYLALEDSTVLESTREFFNQPNFGLNFFCHLGSGAFFRVESLTPRIYLLFLPFKPCLLIATFLTWAHRFLNRSLCRMVSNLLFQVSSDDWLLTALFAVKCTLVDQFFLHLCTLLDNTDLFRFWTENSLWPTFPLRSLYQLTSTIIGVKIQSRKSLNSSRFLLSFNFLRHLVEVEILW